MKVCCLPHMRQKLSGQKARSLLGLKGASVEEPKAEGATELKSKINSLTAILKSFSFGTNKLQGEEKEATGSQCRKMGRGRVKLPQILC